MNDLRITVNGEPRTTPSGTTVAALVAALGMDAARVAVERNQDVVPRRTWAEAQLVDGDNVEIVAFVGGGSGEPRFGGGAGAAPRAPAAAGDPLVPGGRRFQSRPLGGTGKDATIEQGRPALLRP